VQRFALIAGLGIAVMLSLLGCGSADRPASQSQERPSSDIAFSFGGSLYALAPDGSTRVRLTRPVAGLSGMGRDSDPAWSPDATMLAYTSGPTNTTGDIHVMTTAGVNLRRLAPYEGIDESPDWQPIPAPATDRRCGDADSGARDVRAAGHGLSCRKALELAARWSATADRPTVVGPFDAETVDFGGTLRVVLTHRGNRDDDRTGNGKLVAFLYQQPATD
jgi:hypothetical protein